MSGAGAISPRVAKPGGAALLDVRGIAKSFGRAEVLKSIYLQIAPGEFLTLLGESGSGKTTLLRLIAGFEQPTSGEIWMNGEHLDALPANKRQVNTVFQNYALFPHLNVRENVAYGLRVKAAPKAEIAGRVEEALGMVKMSDFAGARPATLSGGQQQRVALARALINRPQLLLLDEPLSALDANLRKRMQGELKALQREIGIAFLFVTHDQDEAMALSDRIALLRNGALEQIASPREIYSRPATAYAAEFIGQTNLLRGEVASGIARCGTLEWPTLQSSGPAVFSLRPEAIQLAETAQQLPDGVRFRGRIQQQTYGGASELLEIDGGSGHVVRARIPVSGPLSGEHEFIFSAADAVRVSESAATREPLGANRESK
ncbi:MAG TPA: ABC transporter ATP-binding protein [Candidatus Acidoferrum sp.]|nr:ABC transporter ATP-binding protein [Candidatus Acidoferrum sp.]